jgi:hypothetical protein
LCDYKYCENTWNVDYFKVQDVFKLSEFAKNDIVYVEGLHDILSNSHEFLRHILRLKPEYVICSFSKILFLLLTYNGNKICVFIRPILS